MQEEDWNSREVKQKFYTSKEWRDLREYKLSLDPFCFDCKNNGYFVGAVHVHHKIDINEDPSKRLDIKNLISLCKKCHSRITMSKMLKINNPKSKENNKQTLFKRKWKI